MQCTLHMRKSFDLAGQHFVLRLSPRFSPETRRSESFTSVVTLGERLLALGVPMASVGRTFASLDRVLDAVWNIQIPQNTFEGFGRMSDRGLGGHGSVAA